MGVNHSTIGTATVNAICNLALLTGQHRPRRVRRRFPSPGNATRWARAKPDSLRACRAIANSTTPADRAELAAPVEFDEARLPAKRGLAYPDIIEAAVAKKIRALWIIAHQSAGLLSRIRTCCGTAFESRFSGRAGWLPSDADHGTGRSGAAAAIWGEKEGTYTNSERRVSKVNKAVEPPGEARSDFDIFLALAENSAAAKSSVPGWTTP